MPSAGDWSITLESGFPRADVTIAALPVIAPRASLTRAITDIARATGLSESNVGTILYRAVQTLRERW